jgi:serine/threonine protein kinase
MSLLSSANGAEELAALVRRAGEGWREAIRTDQMNRWIEGNGVPAEVYRAALPELRCDIEAWHEVIKTEFLIRVDLHEGLVPAEYLQRFPEHAEALRWELERYVAAGSGASGPLPSYPGSADPVTVFLGVSNTPRPTRLGGFRICDRLGGGAMGLVFRAYDPRFDLYVALKIMRPSLLEGQPTARERFERECQNLGRVKSDHVVTVHQSGTLVGLPFLIMELLAGESLQKRLKRRGQLPWEECARIGLGTARGLAALHQGDIIHRDIKPSNIWLEDQGGETTGDRRERVKILDFGLARAAERDGQLTIGFAGTPGYASPEQADCAACDHRTDLFSLGCVLYQMVTGRQPFQGATTTDVLRQVRDHSPPPAAELVPGLPATLSRLIEQLLAKDPNQRPSSGEEVIRTLSGLREPEDAPVIGGAETDPDLKRVHSAWPRLPLPIRRAILAIVASIV